jgi:DNA-binding Lrp family transcriptional regulator
MSRKPRVKDIETRLISELMRNSRRSDRELAKIIGVSQPTISRTIRKLEKEGKIQEYTIIPNLRKLGYQILAVDFVKLNHALTDEEIEKAKSLIEETLKVMPLAILMLERGEGMGFDGMIISYHRDYSSHSIFAKLLKETGLLNVNRLESFLIDLNDRLHFLPLSLSLLAESISKMKRAKE